MPKCPPQDCKTEDIVEPGWANYELLDSGAFQKLERFGSQIIIRTEPTALWKPALPEAEWNCAQAAFAIDKGKSHGIWQKRDSLKQNWIISYRDYKINLFISASRHIGIFPEQRAQWDWIKQKAANAPRPITVLNLFGYTGMSTLAAAKAGAHVTHVDASRNAVAWAKANLISSGISDRLVRWIVDDANKFVQKEIRRGKQYDAIIMDPPNFGRGPQGEVWKFDKALSSLLTSMREILIEKPLFFIITAYNVPCAAAALGNQLSQSLSYVPGITSCGHLIQKEKSAGRKIPQAIYARWEEREN